MYIYLFLFILFNSLIYEFDSYCSTFLNIPVIPAQDFCERKNFKYI
jgi:hypothetical protein